LGDTLAAVRTVRAASLWVAPRQHLSTPAQYPTGATSIESLAWSNDDAIVFPSPRNASVNLWRATGAAYAPLAQDQNCVEQQPAAVPHSSLVVYSSNCASGGADFNLWQLDTTTGQRLQLTSGSNFDQQPNITPDGRWIVYTSWPSNVPSLWKIPVGGGTPIPIYHPQAWNPALSPDGGMLAFVRRTSTFNSGVFVVPLNRDVKRGPSRSDVFSCTRGCSSSRAAEPKAGVSCGAQYSCLTKG